MSSEPVSLSEALAVHVEGDHATATIRAGFDVFGIPHGGYVAALMANAALQWSGQPDLFAVTTHFLRKTRLGELDFRIREVGSSRRFTSVLVEATQDGMPVLTTVASVGDREQFGGPVHEDRRPPALGEDTLSRRAGESGSRRTAAIAHRLGVRIDLATAQFARGETAPTGVMNARVEPPDDVVVDQLVALIACDVTPPASWNLLGVSGWVPTVELTAHVRARPAPGPLDLRVTSKSISGGFLEEDAEVYDATGQLVLLSRQLALWTEI